MDDINGALAAAAQYGSDSGVGFVFTKNDPFWFLDIDNCLEPCGTLWSPLAIKLASAFQAQRLRYQVHAKDFIFSRLCNVPVHRTRDTQGLGLEFYTEGRFVALTGLHANGNAALDCSAMLLWLVETYFRDNIKFIKR